MIRAHHPLYKSGLCRVFCFVMTIVMYSKQKKEEERSEYHHQTPIPLYSICDTDSLNPMVLTIEPEMRENVRLGYGSI